MGDLDLLSLFLLGLLGTGHCLGMCGPLVLAIPGATGRFLPHLYYHLGRITTYTALGLLFGAIGAGLAQLGGESEGALATVTRIQFGLSLFAAIFLFVFGLNRIGLLPEPRWMRGISPAKIPGFGKALRSATSRGNSLAILVTGILLGFLPCGLSYAAFARALPAGGALEGAALTGVFALGTLPGLLLLGTAASGFARRYRAASDIISGVLMIGMAALLGVDAFATIG